MLRTRRTFRAMERQFHAISEMGIKFADLTDNHNGGMLGVEYGFAASVSLDSHPTRIRAMAEAAGVELTAFCAHANLLDPAGLRSMVPKKSSRPFASPNY